MLKRRDVLKWGAGAAAGGLVAPAEVLAQASPDAPAAAPPAPQPPAAIPTAAFDAQAVVDMARALSKQPFHAPAGDLPDAFANLSREQYAGITRQPGSAVWNDANVGFAIEPLHRGFLYAAPVQINVVENGVARRLVYRQEDFNFGAVKPPADNKDIGFSGFRVLVRRNDAPTVEVAVFQGASFFWAAARGQIYGVKARGLAIRVADQKGEEFPLFRTVWIEQPSLASNALVIHALLDSDSLTGAYRFTLRSGEATIIDTECTLFPRTNIDHVGFATMSATFVAGPLDRRRADDVRPGVFDIEGLQMLNGHDEWIWRPVSSRDTLQVSAFVDENPRGFGSIQRNRDFYRFLDDDNHWEQRPSLWIEPIGDWGPGNVTLIEIPSDSEVNQNILAYWRPRNGLQAGVEVSFAYRQFWCWTPPSKPPAAQVGFSRAGRSPGGGNNARRRRFLVSFSSDSFADPEFNKSVNTNLTVYPGNVITQRTTFDLDRKSARILFDIDTGSDTLCELRLLLEAQGKPISETWLYRWTP